MLFLLITIIQLHQSSLNKKLAKNLVGNTNLIYSLFGLLIQFPNQGFLVSTFLLHLIEFSQGLHSLCPLNLFEMLATLRRHQKLNWA
jgi:hypothetical protein